MLTFGSVPVHGELKFTVANVYYAEGNPKKGEDRGGIIWDEGRVVCVVTDGMGGLGRGAEAAEAFIRSVNESILGEADAVRKVFAAGQRAVHRAAMNREGTIQNIGTTASVVLIDGNELSFAVEGDSPIYIYSAFEKTLRKVSIGHDNLSSLAVVYGQEYVDWIDQASWISTNPSSVEPSGEIVLRSLEDYRLHMQKHPLYRHITPYEYMEPDLVLHQILPGDIFVCMTDGISDVLTFMDLDTIIRNTPVNKIAEVLIREAERKVSLSKDQTESLLSYVNTYDRLPPGKYNIRGKEDDKTVIVGVMV
jgi:serine/threonine protein phosphatase PrpC